MSNEESAVAILATSDVEKAAESIQADAGEHSNVAIPVQAVNHAEGDQEEAEAIELDEDAEQADGQDAETGDDAAEDAEQKQEEAEAQEVADAIDVDQEVVAAPDTAGSKSPSAQRTSRLPVPREATSSPRTTRGVTAESAAAQESPVRNTRGASRASSSASAVSTGANGSQGNGNSRRSSRKVFEEEPVVIEGEPEIEEDEQYEIEAILSHQKSGRSKHRYLVSWVGYGPEHNSWVLEEDFASKELIDEFWANEREKTTKKNDMTGSSRKRKASEVQSPALASQRSMRGRHSQPGDTEEQEEAEASDEAGKNGEEEVKRPTSAYVHEHIDDIEPYMNIANWEDQVQEITTVERKPNTKKLIVYMVMVGGERVAGDEDVVYKRCPQKMLQFYGKHLKWSANK